MEQLEKQVSEVCYAIEALPPSEEATRMIVIATELLQEVRKCRANAKSGE